MKWWICIPEMNRIGEGEVYRIRLVEWWVGNVMGMEEELELVLGGLGRGPFYILDLVKAKVQTRLLQLLHVHILVCLQIVHHRQTPLFLLSPPFDLHLHRAAPVQSRSFHSLLAPSLYRPSALHYPVVSPHHSFFIFESVSDSTLLIILLILLYILCFIIYLQYVILLYLFLIHNIFILFL